MFRVWVRVRVRVGVRVGVRVRDRVRVRVGAVIGVGWGIKPGASVPSSTVLAAVTIGWIFSSTWSSPPSPIGGLRVQEFKSQRAKGLQHYKV